MKSDDPMMVAAMTAAAQLQLAVLHSADSGQREINERFRHALSWLNAGLKIAMDVVEQGSRADHTLPEERRS